MGATSGELALVRASLDQAQGEARKAREAAEALRRARGRPEGEGATGAAQGSVAGRVMSWLSNTFSRCEWPRPKRAASIPARSEADWDRFMAYIRQQGAAVTVTKTRVKTPPVESQPIRPSDTV